MTRQDIIEYLKQKKHFFQEKYYIKQIGLFGSFAANEQIESSDIDLVYELIEGKSLSYYQFIELEELLSDHFNRKIELVNYKYMNPIIKFKTKDKILYV